VNRVDYQLIDITEDGFVCFSLYSLSSSLQLYLSILAITFVLVYIIGEPSH